MVESKEVVVLRESSRKETLSKRRKRRRRVPNVRHWPYDSLDGRWMSIRDSEDMDKEREIKKWMYWILNDFENAKVKGFSSRAWKNGYAFCAIMSLVFPKELDYNKIVNDENSSQVKRLMTAMDLAESRLGVKRPEKLLQDILSKNPKDAYDTIDRSLLLNYLLDLQPEVDFRLASCFTVSEEEKEEEGENADTDTDTEY
jgi:hypothetical protein